MKHSILVADDDPSVRRVIRWSLEKVGYAVCEAANGVEAIHALRTAAFDLLITDILMPEQDGFETIVHARKKAPATKIIAISGAENDLYLTNALGLGATRTLPKPFKPADLVRMVKDLLQPAASTSVPS
jgi:CheY-like chemotaxis protein